MDVTEIELNNSDIIKRFDRPTSKQTISSNLPYKKYSIKIPLRRVDIYIYIYNKSVHYTLYRVYDMYIHCITSGMGHGKIDLLDLKWDILNETWDI